MADEAIKNKYKLEGQYNYVKTMQKLDDAEEY